MGFRSHIRLTGRNMKLESFFFVGRTCHQVHFADESIHRNLILLWMKAAQELFGVAFLRDVSIKRFSLARKGKNEEMCSRVYQGCQIFLGT
jgi:hypothetical protein